MSQCITGMNHPDSNMKSLGEYGLTGSQASTEGSLEVHGHEFKVTKSAQGVCVCVSMHVCTPFSNQVIGELWKD